MAIVWRAKVLLPRDFGQPRIIHFIHRQARDIRIGGLPVLLRKVLTFLGIAPGVLVVLIVRVLRPVVVIRFGRLQSSRIGHFAANTELYLCERDMGMQRGRTFDIFYHGSSRVCNQQLKKMWDRTLRVSPFVSLLDRINSRLPGYESHAIPMPSDRDVHGLLASTPVHLSFTPEEERLGHTALQELGISDGAPFVCFHSRDSTYLDNASQDKSLSYHHYRDSSIKNLIPVAEELVSRGYFPIRMGAIVKEELNTSNPMIIDYATKGRTDFLDIYLGAKCRFFICDTAGIYAIPTIFRRPMVRVNMIPLEYSPTSGPNYLLIPKKLWLQEERRFMTFREILDSGVGRFLESPEYERLGIEVVENTTEEITAVAVEMDERLKGTWQTTKEDEELQRQFWSLFKPSELNGVIQSRVGSEFLCQNRALLE